MKIGRIVKLTAAVLLVFGSLITLFGESAPNAEATRAGEEDDPFCTFSASILGGSNHHFIGSVVDFSVQVYCEYDGYMWEYDGDYWDHDDLHNATLEIRYDQVTDEDGNPADVLEPTSTGSLDPYDGSDGEGFLIRHFNTQNYYVDDSTGDLSFKIKDSVVKPGEYHLPVVLNFKIEVNMTEDLPPEVVYSAQVQHGYLIVMIKSNIFSIPSEGFELDGYEGGSWVTYAGSQYLTLRATTDIRRAGSTDLENFRAVLDLGPADIFSISPQTITWDRLSSSSKTMQWKVDISPNAEPRRYMGTVTFTFEKDGETITEAPYNVYIDVEATPLLVPPSTEHMRVPTAVIDQKTTQKTFDINLTNIGNVPFISVKVRLDLDRASYLRQNQFYYDEDYWADVEYFPLEYTANDVPVGGAFVATFDSIGIAEMLPPGDYLIPVDYKVMYVDPYDDSGLEIRLESLQWDELGWYDYEDIMWFREDPRPTDLLPPHIMLRVLDDSYGPDIQAENTQVFTAGDRASNLNVQVMNEEFYPITQATFQVVSDDPDIIYAIGSKGTEAVLKEWKGTLPSANNNGPGSVNLNMLIDVAKNASTQLASFHVRIRGFNNTNSLVEFDVPFDVLVMARAGQLRVTSVMTTKVDPGSSFDMTVTVMNVGGVEIDEFELMLTSNDNLVAVVMPVGQGGDLDVGSTATLTFECEASSSMDHGIVSTMTILTSLEDMEGNQFDFGELVGTNVNVVSTADPDAMNEGYAIYNQGMFHMIAIIIGAFLLAASAVVCVIIVVKNRSPGKSRKDDMGDIEE